MQKMKEIVGSKRQREAVVCSSEKRLRTTEHFSFNRQSSDLLKALKKNPSLDPIPADEFSTSKQALHAAMVKCRFADTIFKAREKKKLLDNERFDSLKIKQEQRMFKRRLLEEKTTSEQRLLEGERKIETQLMTTKLEFKTRRERERNTARITLEKMENTAGIEMNLDVQKEFEILIGCSSTPWESIPSHGFAHCRQVFTRY